jgi:hypothetical protein
MKILAVRSSKVAVVFRKVGGELLPQPGNTEKRSHHWCDTVPGKLTFEQQVIQSLVV